MAAMCSLVLGIVLLASWCALAGEKSSPACSDLREYVYRVRMSDPRADPASGPAGFGSGFFLSADGLFMTALHLFEQAPHATNVVVEIREGSGRADRPVVEIVSFSRSLDFVVARVRLGATRVKVPAAAPSVRPGDRVFGFRIGAPSAKDFSPLAAIACTRGEVVTVSPQEISVKGEAFFLPGSSGSPVFDAGGRVVSIALEMVNWEPEGPKPDWTYASLPVETARVAPKLRRPLTVADFLSTLRREAPASR